jgi:hypothetical protein
VKFEDHLTGAAKQFFAFSLEPSALSSYGLQPQATVGFEKKLYGRIDLLTEVSQ